MHAFGRFAVALIVVFAWPASVRAQTEELEMHTTLNGWADAAWLTILDRDATSGGRLSDQGILQRFHTNIDPDYEITKIRFRFDALDDYTWYRRDRGVRFTGGSVTTRDLGIEADFKQSVPLGGRWSAGVHFTQEKLPDVARSLVRLGFTRGAANGIFEFIESTLTSLKPSADIEIGAGWRRGDTRVSLSVAVLDAFNDLIYQDLKTVGMSPDTALDYERQPIMLHANLDIPVGARFRFEGHGGLLMPSLVRAYVQAVPDSGIRQDERYGFFGALFEWIPSRHVTAGAFVTHVNAVTDRRPLAYGRPLDDFRLGERTTQVGARLLARLAPRWVFQSWARRMWRPERRMYRTLAAPDVNYLDVAWSGQAMLKYGARDGFMLSTSLDVDDRSVVRGAGEVPSFEPLGRNNNEVRFDFGWRLPSQSAFTLGLALELDPGTIHPRGWFGGAHGRFVLYW